MLQKNNIPGLAELIRTDPGRFSHFVLDQGGWRFDYARVPLDREQHDRKLAEFVPRNFRPALDRLFAGRIVNPSEGRPALHMAWRAPDTATLLPREQAASVTRVRKRMLEMAGRLHSGASGLTDLIHVGIGGSDLGPRLVCEALDAGHGAVRVHWLATLDGDRLNRLFGRLDPRRTGLVVASKSFGTVEARLLAQAVIDWLGEDWSGRAFAATAAPERAAADGFSSERILPFSGSVGGRFSLWSPVGLAAAARIGPERWQALLDGAAQADTDVLAQTPGIAPRLALLADFLFRDCEFGALAAVSYEPRLGLLAEYLQQLVMESLGKSVTSTGAGVDGATAPLVFGGRGTDLQHSVFQAIHQGTRRYPVLLVGSAATEHGDQRFGREQLAHLLAQAKALSEGNPVDDPERQSPGGNPVMLLVAERLSAGSLGWLLASLEHAVFLASSLWRINPFDQWGVEAGKRLAADFRRALDGSGPCPDGGFEDWLKFLGRR